MTGRVAKGTFVSVDELSRGAPFDTGTKVLFLYILCSIRFN